MLPPPIAHCPLYMIHSPPPSLMRRCSYERASIEAWFASGKTTSPKTGAQLTGQPLRHAALPVCWSHCVCRLHADTEPRLARAHSGVAGWQGWGGGAGQWTVACTACCAGEHAAAAAPSSARPQRKLAHMHPSYVSIRRRLPAACSCRPLHLLFPLQGAHACVCGTCTPGHSLPPSASALKPLC